MFLRKTSMLLILVSLVCIQGCKKASLFRELSPEDTGIVFSNNITEDGHNNIMTYEYIYNGGGVAVGDMNNDGLTDIYFTGNQVSNKLFLNRGDWKFEDASVKAGVQGRDACNHSVGRCFDGAVQG